MPVIYINNKIRQTKLPEVLPAKQRSQDELRNSLAHFVFVCRVAVILLLLRYRLRHPTVTAGITHSRVSQTMRWNWLGKENSDSSHAGLFEPLG